MLQTFSATWDLALYLQTNFTSVYHQRMLLPSYIWQRSTHLLWEDVSFREWAKIKMYKLWTVNSCFVALGTGYLGHNKAMSPLQPGHNNDTEIDLEYLNIKEEVRREPSGTYEWP